MARAYPPHWLIMPEDQLAEILAFTRRTTELTADHTIEIEEGWIFDSPSLPLIWSLNHLRLSRPASFERAVTISERAHGQLRFRRITLEPAAASAELEGQFQAAGWKLERDVLMVLNHAPAREVYTDVVVEVGAEAQRELELRWTLEDEPEPSAEVLRAVRALWEREAQARHDLVLGIRDPSIAAAGPSGAVAKAKLRSDGRVAQVEDVYALPEARGRGYGRAVVARAVELAMAAGHELIFIVGDDDGWPKHLYAQIGFEPIGRVLHAQLRAG